MKSMCKKPEGLEKLKIFFKKIRYVKKVVFLHRFSFDGHQKTKRI